MKKSFFICALAAVLVVLSTGCGSDNVKVYHVEKDDTSAAPASTAAAPAMMAAGLPVPDNSNLPKLKYTVPDSWQEKTPTELRVASFEISESGKNADVSVIPLSGMAGGDLANVNRWRGQVGLPRLADADLQLLAEKVEIAGQPADLYDASGTTPGSGDDERIIAVIFHQDDTSWFFKMTGDTDLVEKQKPAFVSFLKSLQFGGAAAPSPVDLGQLPPSHPAVPGLNVSDAISVAASTDQKPKWTIPAGWQEGQLAQFLVAKYVIAGSDGAQAAVNVSSLAGDGGGLLPNVNRWRQQLGLGPMAGADLANLAVVDASGGKATVVDISGTDGRTGKPARLVGVELPFGGQTWFYKLMGDEGIVKLQKDAFMKFIQSAKYSDEH